MAVDDNKRGFEHLFAYVYAKALKNAENKRMGHNNDFNNKRGAFGRLAKGSTSGSYQKKALLPIN